jgi:sugar phosphate isomerase/epimerase
MTSHLSRRHFLRSATAAAVGVAALPALLRADEKRVAKKDDPFGGFTLGCQSYTFRNFNTEQALTRMKDLGLHYVELYQKHAPLESSPEQITALLKLCKEYEVTPVCWGVQGFTKDNDKNKRVFDFGKALGLKAISADPDPDSFDSLDKLCEEYKIAIAIHPHGPVGKDKLHRWYSADVIMAAVKDHNPLIGSCLDTGHLIRSAQLGKMLDPAEEVRKMGARNFGLHLKDHDNKRKTDVVFGKDGGVLDMVALLKALRDVKFKGHLSIEYEASPEEPTREVAACVDVFKESVKKLS